MTPFISETVFKRLTTDAGDDARLHEYDEKLFIGFNVPGSTAAKPEARGGKWGKIIMPGAPVDPVSPLSPLREAPMRGAVEPKEDDAGGR